MSAPILVLASRSPRRRELLDAAGYDFEIVAAEVDETLAPGEDPEAGATRLARAKAGAVSGGLAPPRLVLAADTLVVLGPENLGQPLESLGQPRESLGGPLEIFGKPDNPAEAKRMLRALSGRTHRVVTGWCLAGSDFESFGAVWSSIAMRTLTASEIDRYVASGEPMDKAGAYAAQGRGVFLIERIDGSLTNVVGLPLAEVKAALDKALAGR